MPWLPIVVFAGGMLGAMARYGASGWLYRRLGSAFPWGTLGVNLAGSLGLGLVIGLGAAPTATTPLGAGLVAGCLGSFTTFSTFAYDAVSLMLAGAWRRAVSYLAASVGLGLVVITAGVILGGWIR